MYIPEL